MSAVGPSGARSTVTGMSPAAATLLVIGAVAELVGIIMVAWPDLIPYREPLTRWMVGVAAAIRRRIRRPSPKVVEARVGVGGAVAVGGHVVGMKGPPPDAMTEQLVAHLLRRDRETQQALDALDVRLKDLRDEFDQREAALDAALTARFRAELNEALTRDRPLRALGAVVLAAGLVCTVVAASAG